MRLLLQLKAPGLRHFSEGTTSLPKSSRYISKVSCGHLTMKVFGFSSLYKLLQSLGTSIY